MNIETIVRLVNTIADLFAFIIFFLCVTWQYMFRKNIELNIISLNNISADDAGLRHHNRAYMLYCFSAYVLILFGYNMGVMLSGKWSYSTTAAIYTSLTGSVIFVIAALNAFKIYKGLNKYLLK